MKIVNKIKKRGFGSMTQERVVEIAKKGGMIRASQLGHEGYVELGRKGGKVRANQLGRDGLVELGRRGGLTKKRKKNNIEMFLLAKDSLN